MVPAWLSTVASVGMAVGPPLVRHEPVVASFHQNSNGLF